MIKGIFVIYIFINEVDIYNLTKVNIRAIACYWFYIVTKTSATKYIKLFISYFVYFDC